MRSDQVKCPFCEETIPEEELLEAFGDQGIGFSSSAVVRCWDCDEESMIVGSIELIVDEAMKIRKEQ